MLLRNARAIEGAEPFDMSLRCAPPLCKLPSEAIENATSKVGWPPCHCSRPDQIAPDQTKAPRVNHDAAHIQSEMKVFISGLDLHPAYKGGQCHQDQLVTGIY